MLHRITVAIDHGNNSIKTPNHVFKSSYMESGHLPSLGSDTLIYGGKEYTLVDNRMPQKSDKTGDEDYFKLTLFALGKEFMSNAEIHVAIKAGAIIEVVLLVGLPPLHCKSMGEKFKHYFVNHAGRIDFVYNSLPISIRIADVHVYPQAYAAAVTAHEMLSNAVNVNIVDIGGYTIDLLLMKNFRPDMAVCISLYNGVNILFQQINEQVRATGAKDISDTIIEGVLQNNLAVIRECSSDRINVIRNTTEQFVAKLLLSVSQAGLDLTENRTLFIGGGSILLKEYIEKSRLVAKSIFLNNVHANAEGYRLLYENRNTLQAGDSQ